jgi:peptidyl-prolyl cis-trans isomerase B (cyclophilin B)
MKNHKYLFLTPLFILSVLLLSSCTKQKTPDLDLNLQVEPTGSTEPTGNLDLSSMNNTNDLPTPGVGSYKVALSTSRGDIVLTLFPQIAPQTVNNFLAKAQSGYYAGLTFHRVEDWVIQGGDPLGNGTGGGQLPTELSQQPFKEGSLGVARGGDINISNDSQFFICTKDCAWLTGQYTLFGQVEEGIDIAQSTQIGDTITAITILPVGQN